jgi:hypothetical protein
MDRRAFLTTTGVALVAGCTSSDGGSTPTETATPTQTSTSAPPAYDVSIEAPDRVSVEEQFTVTVEVTNTGGQSGQFREPVDISVEGESAESLWTVESDVDPGETTSTIVSVPALRQTGQVQLEIPGRDAEATVEVHADNAAPRIQMVTPISEWTEYGDVAENSIDEVRAGDPARIGVRYSIWIHGGEMNSLVQTIIRRDGEQVAVDQAPFERLVEYSGRSDWEAAPAFRTDDWEPGTHTAEVIVRDEINGEQSAAVDATFEVI